MIVLNDPLSPAEHFQLGLSYEQSGELDLAVREYEKALRGDPNHFQARMNLGNVFVARKEYAKARREYATALEIRPDSAEAANNLAWIAIETGDGITAARKAMEAAVASAPENRTPALLDTLGLLRAGTGDKAGAKAAFDEAESDCLLDKDCPPALVTEIRGHRDRMSK